MVVVVFFSLSPLFYFCAHPLFLSLNELENSRSGIGREIAAALSRRGAHGECVLARDGN